MSDMETVHRYVYPRLRQGWSAVIAATIVDSADGRSWLRSYRITVALMNETTGESCHLEGVTVDEVLREFRERGIPAMYGSDFDAASLATSNRCREGWRRQYYDGDQVHWDCRDCGATAMAYGNEIPVHP